MLEPWVYLAPRLFPPVYLHANVGQPSPQSATSPGRPAATLPTRRHLARPGPPATALPRVLSAQLPVSSPPTGLDQCFFFNSLVVRLPYSLTFCQFWLLLSFFWLCEEAQLSTYTSILAGSPEDLIFLTCQISPNWSEDSLWYQPNLRSLFKKALTKWFRKLAFMKVQRT